MPPPVEVCFVHFRATTLSHLDAAWYSLSRQDFSRVQRVWFLDNNTDDAPEAIQAVLGRYPLPVPLLVAFHKHGVADRTHSWSANTVCQAAEGPLLLFTRADYVLAFDALQRLLEEADRLFSQGVRPFVSGWCWQMAYDRQARNIDAEVDIEQYHWREGGMSALLQHPYAFRFHETNHDAGVWLTCREYLEQAGWFNEKMSSWGYQQSTLQRALARKANVRCVAVQDYLFAHLHHFSPRDFSVAASEYQRYGGGI